MPLMIDTHAHLDFPQFKNDLDSVLDRAYRAGVAAIINVGTDEKSSRRSVALSRMHRKIRASVGVHPHGAANVSERTMAELEIMAAEDSVLAIGETGLDFYRNLSPADIQEKVFRKHLRLARKINKPVIIHSREAHDQIIRVLKEEPLPAPAGVMHCFSGELKQLEEFLELGFYISIAGPVTYPKSHQLRELLSAIPEDRLLLETDAPYLSPQAYRGGRNEPAYIELIYERVALALKKDLGQLSKQIYINAVNLFSDNLFD